MKETKIGELNKLYEDAESADREIFAEMRSNVLLLAGDFYSKKDRNLGIREDRKDDGFKLRLVKNHAHKIVRYYASSILANAPGVAILPNNEMDLQDQKDAELNGAVWQQAKTQYRMKERIRQWALDFSGVGELAVLIRWDPNAGDLIGYEQEIGESGEPLFDEDGVTPIASTRPVFTGDFVFEDLFAANLLRDPTAKKMRDAKCIVVRKMVPRSHLMARYKGDEQKISGLQASTQNEAFVVFDSSKGSYEKAEKDVLVKEFYYKKCVDYPEGYFYITAGNVILEEGPLPFGVFPIIWAGFDEFPTSARAHSIIKVARPYIAEICRASSQMALHQITIGDDKILYQKGSKLEQGGLLPGVRGISYQGKEPTVLNGRDGGQYLAYIQAQIHEMYSVLMIEEVTEEKLTTLDPNALLFRATSQSKKFSIYVEKFEQFLIDMVSTYLELAKQYLPDDALIPAVGSNEAINIAEFRKTTKLRHQIKVEPREDTIETLLGKHLTYTGILQYVGKQLSPDQLGVVIQQMPYANGKEAFADFTLDDTNAKNDMLALERGEQPPLGKYDDPAKMAKKLSSRMRRSDFRFLPPPVQQAYEARVAEYERLEADQQRKILAAKAEYIPTDGPMVKCDFYVEDPANPGMPTKRAMFPQNALDWLKKQMEAQGSSMERLEGMQPQAMADIAQMLLMNGGAPAGAGTPMPPQGPGMAPLPFGQAG